MLQSPNKTVTDQLHYSQTAYYDSCSSICLESESTVKTIVLIISTEYRLYNLDGISKENISIGIPLNLSFQGSGTRYRSGAE